MLASLMSSNGAHIDRAIDVVVGLGLRRIALLGLTFKPGTDDLRDSALVAMTERLIGKGFDLRIFDPNFAYADIIGRNRQFILTALPHIGSLLVSSLAEALEHGETVIVGHSSPAFADLPSLIKSHHQVFDIAAGAAWMAGSDHYQGICW
jgi:GDP-mannose 6-dehydrogenase